MSVADLLPAIRALPKAEQVQLLHLLIDGVAQPTVVTDELPEELAQLFHPGFVAEVWFPEPNPVAAGAVELALKEGRVADE